MTKQLLHIFLFLNLLPLLAQEPASKAAESAASEDPDAAYREIERFIDTLETVRENHPDLDKTSYKRLIDHALEGVLGSLDRYSGYYHPETQHFIEENGPTSPHLESLGLTLAQKGNTVYVDLLEPFSVKEGEPLPDRGDYLRLINGKEIKTLEEAMKELSGAPGELKEVTFYKKSDPSKSYTTTFLHRFVYPKALTESRLLTDLGHPKTGYLHLNQFTKTSHREIESALDELEDKSQGLTKLILDLRANPGGLLDQSVKILGEFLPPSTEVVWTKGQNGKFHDTLKTPDRQRKKRDYPLLVLIDKNSASASELVAAALQDLKRATVIGETSYGKGSVQNIIGAGGGNTFRLTIAKYHTPSGKTPHEVGVTPDHEVPLTTEDHENFKKHLIRQKLSSEAQEQLKNWQDPALKKALSL